MLGGSAHPTVIDIGTRSKVNQLLDRLMGNKEWLIANSQWVISHSPLPTPHSPAKTN